MTRDSDATAPTPDRSWQIVVGSNPDCEDLTAEISLRGVLFCVLDQEEGADRIRICFSPNAHSLGRIELAQFDEKLALARSRLSALRLHCPVCGYDGALDRERAGSCAVHSPGCGCPPPECPSCGFRFYVADLDPGFDVASARARWIASGMRWRSGSRPAPAQWDPIAQLSRVEAK
jgi:hypothetical protein